MEQTSYHWISVDAYVLSGKSNIRKAIIAKMFSAGDAGFNIT